MLKCTCVEMKIILLLHASWQWSVTSNSSVTSYCSWRNTTTCTVWTYTVCTSSQNQQYASNIQYTYLPSASSGSVVQIANGSLPCEERSMGSCLLTQYRLPFFHSSDIWIEKEHDIWYSFSMTDPTIQNIYQITLPASPVWSHSILLSNSTIILSHEWTCQIVIDSVLPLFLCYSGVMDVYV